MAKKPSKGKKRENRAGGCKQCGGNFFNDVGQGFGKLIGIKKGDSALTGFAKGVFSPVTVAVKGIREGSKLLTDTTGLSSAEQRGLAGEALAVTGNPVAGSIVAGAGKRGGFRNPPQKTLRFALTHSSLAPPTSDALPIF